ncbi:MAG TPA: DUF1015 domain-containing protein [Gemmatimonadales bacterium]|nr:DUF1015 domain-containing protein [Gemmatimonadales bacterium]
MGHAVPLVTSFRGERYADVARLSSLIAPPYDIISPEQRKRYAALDAHNIVHLILPEAPIREERYLQAAQLLAEWRRQGVFVTDPAPAVYVVAQVFTTPDGRRLARTGMFAGLAAEPYEMGRVRPHERTHAAPKQDRLSLLRATRTSLESILVIAPDPDGALLAGMGAVAGGARTPDAAAELDGVQISLWVVTGADALGLAESAGRRSLYIADGHHRFETAVAYARENPAADRLLSFIVSARDPGLAVLATHRVIYAVGRDLKPIMERWKRYFEISDVPADADRAAHLATLGQRGTACIVATAGKHDYALLLRRDAPLQELPELGRTPAARSLDAAIVERLVVQEILGAGTSTPTLNYTPDARTALSLAWEGKATAVVLLNPTPVAQVIAVADAADVMPQKSTYFIPKVPSGLVLRPL